MAQPHTTGLCVMLECAAPDLFPPGEVHAHEAHVCEMHACGVHAHETHAYEIHAREMPQS